MKIFREKWVVLSLVFALLLSLSGGIVIANDHSKHYSLALFVNWGKHTEHIEWWYEQEGDKDFTEMIITAADAWNDTPTSLNMTQVDSKAKSILRIYSNDYGDTGWYARFNSAPDIHIGINEHYYLDKEQWETVIAHEMGHAHGLDHYDDCEEELMNSSPINRGDCEPNDGDIAGINAKYGEP